MQRLPGIVPLYSAVEMRTVDRLAIDEIGIPGAVLMERAGLGAAGEILGYFGDARRIAVLCGPGNNGGDGCVVARHLAATGRHVEILLVEADSKVRRDSRTFLEIARTLGIPIERVNVTAWRGRLERFDLVVDAMLGTGASGELRPAYETAVRAVNESMLPVVALDVPTGVDASTGEVASHAVRADLTVTFHGPKIGIAVAPGRFQAGRVKAIDIGIPAQADGDVGQGLATSAVVELVPTRPRWASKYDVGRVVCVGGMPGMSGSITLASVASMRAGAGVAWAAVPAPIAGQVSAGEHHELQVRPVSADEHGQLGTQSIPELGELIGRCDAVCIGPGLGRGEGVRALVQEMARIAPALVIDADALNALAGNAEALATREAAQTLITPHEAELARLLGVEVASIKARRLASAREAAARTRSTVLLKGEDTIVCDPNGEFVVCRSTSTLATAGSGDVLAGTCAALMARGLPPLLAGCCGATVLGIAAELAAVEFSGAGVVASDLPRFIPAALAGRTVEGG